MLELAWSMITTASVVGLTLIILPWGVFQWRHWELLRVARKLPVVLSPNLPIIGHLLVIIKCLRTASGVADVMREQWTIAIEKGYHTICFWIGPFPAMIFTKPDDLKKLLNSSSTMLKGYELETFMKDYLGRGLLTAQVEHWKLTRRHLNPVFHPRNVEMMIPNFNRNSRELVHILSEHVGKQPVDVYKPLTDTFLKTICELLFGLEMQFDMKSEEFQSLHAFADKVQSLLRDRAFVPWLRSDTLFKFLYRKELKYMDEAWKRFSEKPIQQAKRNYERKNKNGLSRNMNVVLESQPKEFLTTVDVYCELQKNFDFITDKDLVQQLVTLYITGSDTVTIGLASCLLAMAQYQDIQEKVYNEISSVVGPEDEAKLEDLKELPYTDKVIKETLRFFHVVPMASRRSSEPVTVGDHTYPAETTFFMCLAGLHMDPQTFPEPESFNPERWTPERTEDIERYAFIPFSAGPRNCIGKQYAYMMMKVMLVHILRRFRLSTTQDIHYLEKTYNILFPNTYGYHISFQFRH